MGVYFRTGPNSAVGVPFWFYGLFVMPIQVMWLFAKMLVLAWVLIVIAGLWACRAAYRGWRR